MLYYSGSQFSWGLQFPSRLQGHHHHHEVLAGQWGGGRGLILASFSPFPQSLTRRRTSPGSMKPNFLPITAILSTQAPSCNMNVSWAPKRRATPQCTAVAFSVDISDSSFLRHLPLLTPSWMCIRKGKTLFFLKMLFLLHTPEVVMKGWGTEGWEGPCMLYDGAQVFSFLIYLLHFYPVLSHPQGTSRWLLPFPSPVFPECAEWKERIKCLHLSFCILAWAWRRGWRGRAGRKAAPKSTKVSMQDACDSLPHSNPP